MANLEDHLHEVMDVPPSGDDWLQCKQPRWGWEDEAPISFSKDFQDTLKKLLDGPISPEYHQIGKESEMKNTPCSYWKSKLLPGLWFPNLSMFSTFRERQHCATAQCILASWQHFSNEDELPDLSQSFRKKSMSIWFFSSSENGVAHIFNSNLSSRWSPLVQLFWVKNGSKFHSSLIVRIIFRESRIVDSWS